MNKLSFVFPIDGDLLNKNDLIAESADSLTEVKILSSAGKAITVNGMTATESDGGIYTVNIPVCDGKNIITASCEGESLSICVYLVTSAAKKFRISTDDNILFLRNINAHKDEYLSIFDDPYLSVYKKAHDLYGACVDINLFYETDDMPGFSDKGEYFNLSMMTDKFKAEWEKSSDWLRLSFHANAEHPSKPYISASYDEVYRDACKVNREIIRFAGESSLSSTATVHWGEATKEGTLAMKDAGYDALAGYFTLHENGTPSVAYYYPVEHIRHIGERDFWKNRETGILHSRIDLVLNVIKYEELEDKLNEIYSAPHRAEFIELMIHEQYFYPEYKRYMPDFSRLVNDAAKWVYDRGYVGTFLDNIKSQL